MRWTNAQLLGAKEPEQLDGGEITANFCSVLGVQPLLGRCFTAGEQAHHDPVAILSYSLWQRQFNGDPNILGRTITLKDDSETKRLTVTGVLPAQFRFPYARLDEKFDVWMPYAQDTDDGGPVSTIARLRPGVTIEQARVELLAMQRHLFPNEYDGNGGAKIVVEPLVNLVTATVKPGLVILFAAVGLVLLITCANVASLFLSRGSVQTREIAVRASLGAGRWRLCRQLLTESLTLSLLGGAAGLLSGSWILHGIKLLASTRLPRVEEAGMNATVLAFTAAVSIFSGVLSGVLPGLRLSRIDLTTAMKAAGSSIIGGRSQQRTMNALVVFEVAVCVVSLIGAGLLVNTLIRLERVDPGFRSDHIVLAGLIEPPGKTAPTEFYKTVRDRVASTPGVEAAGLTENPPPYNVMQIYDFLLPGEESRHGERANSRVVNADYFQALRIPLLHGRLFRDSDNAEAPHVLVISESMARHYWPGHGGVGDAAVGKFVRMGQFGKETPAQIIGVVGDVRQTGLRRAPDNQMYMHYAALGTLPGAPTLVVRVKADPAAFAQLSRPQSVPSIPTSPSATSKTMDELMAGEVADPRFYVILLEFVRRPRSSLDRHGNRRRGRVFSQPTHSRNGPSYLLRGNPRRSAEPLRLGQRQASRRGRCPGIARIASRHPLRQKPAVRGHSHRSRHLRDGRIDPDRRVARGVLPGGPAIDFDRPGSRAKERMTKIVVLHRYTSGTLLVRLEGPLTLSPAVNELKTRIEGLLSTKPASALVLNLGAVSSIDSAGIGELMKIHTFAIRRRLRLVLAGVNPKIGEMLKDHTSGEPLSPLRADEASALQQVAQPQIADQS